MKYFSLNCVKNAYELVSANTKDKFWGILGILYSIDSLAIPGVNFSINTEKLSNFLEQTFRLKDKKTYSAPSSEYSVVFANDWEEKTTDNFIVNTPDIMPIIIWAYRSFAFDRELNSHELFEKFIRDFHLSKDSAEKFFNIKFDGIVIEYSDNEYDDVDLFNKLGGNQAPDAATIKMNKSFVVANAGDLSRGPFFQPLYASLNTLECLIIFPFDAKKYYQVFTSVEKRPVGDIWAKATQIIYYGCPGTGKSHIVKKQTERESVVRTTFHPDSDYSTFVGCYKPTTKHGPRYTSYGEKAVVIKDAEGKELTEDRIVYEFVDQAFLQSYIKAWKFYTETLEGPDPKKQFLIIEEINRGNCAQIFGDLFQLLDRNDDGFSDYYIHADRDMQKHLAKAFNGIAMNDSHKNTINAMYHNGERDIVAQVLNGEILLLPNNLYIWATMNTSDQSLFPIDSAFKRRWDWKYRPIVKGRDKDGNELNWRIKAGTKEYDWWSFLEKINAIVGTTTNSEDKKLGFFFCKPIDSVISAETFVGKVIFYLWNDVFKNFGFDDTIFKDSDGSTLEFDKFYTSDANGDTIVRADKVERFLENLKVKIAGEIITEVEDEDGNTISSSTRDYTKYSINGVGRYGKNILASECVKEYIKLNPEMSVEDVLENWKSLGYIVTHFVESKEEHDTRTDNSIRSVEIPCGDTFVYVEKNGYGNNGAVDRLIAAVNQKDWNIKIDKVE